MSAVMLGVYALVGVAHEVAAWRFWTRARQVAKGLLLPVLLVYYCLAAHTVLAAVIVAIVFSWLGDLLLLRKDDPKYFRGGMVAFMLSHVFYLVALVSLTSSWHVGVLVASIVVALIAEVFLPRLINPPKAMFVPIVVYGVVILAMSVVALQYALSAPGVWSSGLFVGSLVFVFSDVLMTFLAYGRRPKYFDAITMLPYIVAQGLIVLGLAMA